MQVLLKKGDVQAAAELAERLKYEKEAVLNDRGAAEKTNWRKYAREH